MEDFKIDATEKLAHIEESLKSAHKRIDSIETLTKSVYELASSIKTMQRDITDMSGRIKTIEENLIKNFSFLRFILRFIITRRYPLPVHNSCLCRSSSGGSVRRVIPSNRAPVRFPK